MDEDYDYDFSTYNSTSDSSFITNQQTDSLDQDDDNIQISHSQSPAPSSNEITDTTEILSGSNYATLGIMVPTVEELIYRFSNIDSEIDIINEVKETILSNLTSRWSLPHDYGMFASLLDPRFKDLSFCSNAQKRRMIEELKIKFNELSGHENQHDESPEQTELD
ncbi:1855_t:CDS:2, partial [Dentiscutata heterogama]